jgi:hypothetical protein
MRVVFEAVWRADMSAPRRVREALREWLAELGWATHDTTALLVAVSEAVTNSVEHALRGSRPDHGLALGLQDAYRVIHTVETANPIGHLGQPEHDVDHTVRHQRQPNAMLAALLDEIFQHMDPDSREETDPRQIENDVLCNRADHPPDTHQI